MTGFYGQDYPDVEVPPPWEDTPPAGGQDLPPERRSTGDGDKPARQSTSPKESAAARLCRIAAERYTFGRASTGEPFALPVTGPRIVHMLRGGPTSLRAELAAEYLAEYGTPPTQQALADALTAIEGMCLSAEPTRLWLRVAEHDGALWIDTGNDAGQVIRVSPDGWQVADTAPVLHRRTALTAPMPTPTPGGDLDELWSLLNVAERDRPVLVGFMVAALLPEIPHPILSLGGEQGTGKSTASRIIATTLDPSTVPLRKAPRDHDTWTTAAAGSHVVALDNLSGMPEWLSDALCRASTGDGDVRRRLYSDGDLYVSSFRRVVIVNGIDLGTVRDDLADRLVTVELHRIEDTDRRREDDLARRWEAAAPGILGGLLDLTAQVLAILPTVRLDRAPRMADFAHVLAAVDRVRGTDALGRYRELSGDLAADAVSSDPVLTALTATVTAPWTGATAELLPLLDETHRDGKPPRDWPRSARSLSGVLKRRAPSLRRVGWTVEQTGERTERGLLWRLVPPAGHALGAPDEILTKPLTKPDEPVSSAVRQEFRQDETCRMTCEDAESGRNPDEMTNNPSNLSLSVQEERENGVTAPNMRDVPVSSSFRHSVTTAPVLPGQSPPTCTCGRPLLAPQSVAAGTCAKCLDERADR